MKVLHGLMHGQVLQRDGHGLGAAAVQGTCSGPGVVECRLLKKGRVLRGHDWKVVGTAAGKHFEAEVSGLRSGGPYQVELRVVSDGKIIDDVAVSDVFVGDVWILGGQSNMEGIGRMDAAIKPHPMVRAFYMRDEWSLAEGKMHFLAEAVDCVHNGYGKGPGRPAKGVLQKARAAALKGIGPGQAFGIEMFKRTGVPQGLICCAHGGTSMTQWSPEKKALGGDSLYGAMMRRYERLGQSVAGVVWYQGESDASEVNAPLYTDRMEQLVSATRRDFGIPGLPWIIVQLGRHAANAEAAPWNSIQEQQRCLRERVRHLDVVPAVDLGMDDGIHISGQDQHRLGRRLARAAFSLVHKQKGAKPSIVLDKIELVPTPGFARGDTPTSIRISYRNVSGRLGSPGSPWGFSLKGENGVDANLIYRVTLERNAVLLHTTESRMELERMRFCYGAGRFPYCNITDAEDMSIPVVMDVPVADYI